MFSLLLIKRKLNHLDPSLLFNLLLPLVQDFRKIFKPATVLISYTVWKVCPYSEFFWSVLSCIRTESGEIRSISPYSVWMWENADQKNSKYGHFLCSVIIRDPLKTYHGIFVTLSLLDTKRWNIPKFHFIKMTSSVLAAIQIWLPICSVIKYN